MGFNVLLGREYAKVVYVIHRVIIENRLNMMNI